MVWSALLFASFLSVTLGDVYFHYPPGANNRLDEQNRERNNANRMMDSENNNRGGYNVGKTSYYVGEKVPMMWTNQHGSSNYQMEHTEFVIQYMCDPLLRDGTTTNTIPEKQIDCQNFDCDTDVRFGRHESYDYYQRCTQTERNKGLFTINQNLKGNTAQYTRQNAAGTRHGYECPEERDYYPYWRASPWVDIAYFTNDVARCAEVQKFSQNVMDRHECRLGAAFYDLDNYPQYLNNKIYPNTQEECSSFEVDVDSTDDVTGVTTTSTFNATWVRIPPHNVEAPECIQTEQTRANHLGVVGGRTQFSYEWTIPADLAFRDRCALRLRYNITTNDYEAWETAAELKAGANSTVNSQKTNPNPGNDPAELDMWSKFGIGENEVKDSNGNFKNDDDSREYILKNNPQVEIIRPANAPAEQPGYTDDGGQDFRFKLQLAVNTAQFGRTFQDRTHGFAIKDRPANVPADANIVLQSVSGKRGNIVQTFPAHEYFFIPEVNNMEVDDYVHFMWTGSNTNPDNNDGQGKQGTDRSNIVPLRVQKYGKESYSDFTWDASWQKANSELAGGMGETGDSGNSYPAYVQNPEGYEIPEADYGQTTRSDITLADNLIEGAFGGLSKDTLAQLATSRQSPNTDFGNMEELDDASTSVNLPLQKVSAKGCWNYVSTRNNNFSNRSQKGKLCVLDGSVTVKMVGQTGAEIWSNHGDSLTIWPNTMNGVSNIRFETRQTEASDVATVSGVPLVSNAVMTLGIRYSPQALKKPMALHRSVGATEWTELDDVEYKEVNDQHVAVINHDQEGEYKVGHKANAGAMVGIIFGVIFFVCGMLYVLYDRCSGKNSGNVNASTGGSSEL